MSKEANARYDAKSTRHYGFKFNVKTDADIIAALDAAPNKQALIKEALRAHTIPSSWTGFWPASPQCPACGGKVDDEIIYMLDGQELPNYCPYCGKNLTGEDNTMYDELLKVAIKYDASFEDKKALADWLFQHGNTGWNGEAWDISDSGSPTGSRMMRPVYGPEDEYGDAELIDYEII